MVYKLFLSNGQEISCTKEELSFSEQGGNLLKVPLFIIKKSDYRTIAIRHNAVFMIESDDSPTKNFRV